VGALMIMCPNTGQPISTGIETDEYSLKQIQDVPSRTHCPLCGLDHTWWKREARLVDDTPRGSRPRPPQSRPRVTSPG
jgi:hypothetical protein